MKKLFNKIKSFFTRSKEKNLSLEERIKEHVLNGSNEKRCYKTVPGPFINKQHTLNNPRIPGMIMILEPITNIYPEDDNNTALLGKMKTGPHACDYGTVLYNRKGECINDWFTEEYKNRFRLSNKQE